MKATSIRELDIALPFGPYAEVPCDIFYEPWREKAYRGGAVFIERLAPYPAPDGEVCIHLSSRPFAFAGCYVVIPLCGRLDIAEHGLDYDRQRGAQWKWAKAVYCCECSAMADGYDAGNERVRP